MRTTFPALRAFGLAAALAFPLGAAFADAPRTVSDFATAMHGYAGKIDALVSERQKAGDMAAAQRLVLAAAMLRRTADEFRNEEQDALPDPVSGLPAPIPELADAALAKAAEALTRAGQHAAFADEAHVTFNALLAALPAKRPHPVLFGMLSGDLADEIAPLGRDIVIYGYRLIDPVYKIDPVVLYGRTEISGKDVVLKDDRIDVTLPEEVKTAVHFAPPPCSARASFGLRVRNVYSQSFGRWPIIWHSQVTTNADFYALPTPVIYSAAITASAETTSSRSSNVDFRQRGSLAVADCEATKPTSVQVALPENARDATCSVAWVDTANAARTASRCSVEGRTVRAVGEISGGGKICSPEKLCTCASQAQGWLEVSGSYRVEQTSTQYKVDTDFPPLAFPSGGVANGRIGVGDGDKLRHVSLALTRRACPTPVDSIDLNVGDDPEARVTGVSKTGAFRASIHAGALTVGAADAIAASGERTP